MISFLTRVMGCSERRGLLGQRGKPQRGQGREQAGVYQPHQRQLRLRGPLRVRRHHHGPRLSHCQPGPDRQQRGRQPDPRSRHRQDCRGTAHQADDPWPDRKGSRGPDCERIFEIICCSQPPHGIKPCSGFSLLTLTVRQKFYIL